MMLPIIGILAVVVVIIVLEVPRLMRSKLYKEIWVFSFMMLVGSALSIAIALHLRLPNLIDWMIVIYNPIVSAFNAWLE
jgi:hypothetical protein